MNITVAGVGYVGLAQAVLLAQHNAVTAVTTTPAKAENINRGVSPIVDAEITDFLRTKPLTLTATVDAERAYRTADVVIIATPTDYDPEQQIFNTSPVEAGNALVKEMRDDYDTVSFLNPDGTLNTAPCVKYQTRLLKEKGFVDEDQLQQVESMTIYPTEYFCPMHYETGALTITEHTISIHHYESTHWGTRARMGNLRMRRAYQKYGKIGFFLYSHSRLLRGLDMLVRGEWQQIRDTKN